MKIWNELWIACCSPGRQHTITCAAPTQFINSSKTLEQQSDDCPVYITGEEIPSNTSFYDEKTYGGRLFDQITLYAGARATFIITLVILITWAIVGIILDAPENWQIVMQDGSSIQCYVSDTLLMRQQQNHCYALLTFIAQLRSRNATHKRLLHAPEVYQNLNKECISMEKEVGDALKLPTENWFDTCCDIVSFAVGSIPAWVIYWSSIMVWIGLGASLGWSDVWQLYINTGVAVELTFTSMFLQNTRHRHMKYLEKCLASIMKADCELEIALRQRTHDIQPNPTVTIAHHNVSRSVRAIDYYGDVIGTGVGAVISISVFIVWIAMGSTMQWDSNWWLIIGTYTGLVGFVDGFVLRNVYFRQDVMLDEQFAILTDADQQLFQYLDLPFPENPVAKDGSSLHTRISGWMGRTCATSGAVLFSLIVVVVLIGIASGMQWNQTGQLLCNTPTMIMEGFLLIVLIQAHNMSNTKRRVTLYNVLLRRIQLLQYVQEPHLCEKREHDEEGVLEK